MKPRHPNIVVGIALLCSAILLSAMFYSVVAFPIFQWRNPKANSMTYYSEFGNVVTFQKIEKYQ